MIQEGGTFIRDMFPRNHSFAFEIDKLTHLPPYLTAGIGYTFLPRSLVQPYLDNGSLISIPLLDFKAPTIEVYMVIPESKADHNAICHFTDTLQFESE